MLELLSDLMASVPGRCDYAEARHVDRRSLDVSVSAGRIDALDDQHSEGVGVRVKVGGGWGFAATRELTARGLERALAPPARGHWAAPFEIDPVDVALDDRLALLLAAEAALRTGDRRLVRTDVTSTAWRERWAFASTAGAACTQQRVGCGAGMQAWAADGTDVQVRSYPSGHAGDVAGTGWEHVLALDLVSHAPRVAEEAVALLSAPECPAGSHTVVLHGEQLALQIHESVGHALELDRVLLGEASYAGTSWVSPADLGRLRYGSDLMHVTADATLPGALGTFGWDDEGIPGERATLIEGGLLRLALSDRQSAAAVGLPASGGCARADGFARQPIVRMTNVSLAPGDAGSLADLLADTGSGLYLETNRSWSIDDRRLQFQFACETAREIRGGELGRLYRNPSYSGITPRFWASMDAICSAQAWRPWGLTNCGKGEPGQIMAVSHGTAPARFRDVQVGAARP
jgi:TldD protein